MTAVLTVLLDTDGDNVPETEIAGYIVGGKDRKALNYKDGTSSTSTDYAAGTMSITVKDPDGDFSMENPFGAFRSTIASHTASPESDVLKNATTQQQLAQGFKIVTADELDKLELYLKWTGSAPAGSAFIEIWHTSGGEPWALFEATAISRSRTAAQVGTSYGWQAFTFEVPPLLDDSTTYAVVLKTSGYTYSVGVNELYWATNGATGFSGGHASRYNGSAWSWLNNGISNPSFESATTGWSGIAGTTITRITTDGYDGSSCLQVDPPGAVGTEGALFGGGAVAASASTAYTFRVAIKGTPGLSYRLAWDENNGGGGYLRTQTSAVLTLSGSGWNWFTLSASTGVSTATVNLYIYHNAVNSTRFYIDKAQFSADSSPQGDFKIRATRNNIRDGRMVWIGATESATLWPIWTGFLRAVLLDPDPERLEATLIFTDSDDDAKLAEARLATRANYRAQDALNELWTSAAPAGLGLSTTQISIGNEEEGLPVWFQQPHDSISAVTDKIADAYGGRVRWKAVSSANGWKRQVFRSVVADQVESGTAIEDWASDYKVEDLEYRWNAREALLINRAIVRANPRKAGAEKVVVGRYSGALPEVWGRAETRDDIWIDFSDPIVRSSGISPAAGTDITTGWTVNSVAWYSQKALLSITSPNVAAASGRTLDKLQLRATPYELQPEVVATVEDTISQGVYNAVREHRVDNPYIQTYGRAKSLAQALVRKFRRAYVNPRVHRIGHNANATTGEVDTWESLCRRDIGDRVTLTLPTRVNGGFSSAYYIEGREGAISIVNESYVIGQWDIWYRLRKSQDGYQFLGIDSGSNGQVIDIGVIAP